MELELRLRGRRERKDENDENDERKPELRHVLHGSSYRIRATPASTKITPAARAMAGPAGETFSRSTTAERAATQARFITPVTNRSAMINQQHPAQKAPCVIPMRSAPARPSRHDVVRKPSGERQCVRQVCLMGSHW